MWSVWFSKMQNILINKSQLSPLALSLVQAHVPRKAADNQCYYTATRHKLRIEDKFILKDSSNHCKVITAANHFFIFTQRENDCPLYVLLRGQFTILNNIRWEIKTTPSLISWLNKIGRFLVSRRIIGNFLFRGGVVLFRIFFWPRL